mmetsp:Transcript_20969/g.38450  ORF Transcript_20969/g.38450 Transcript_20969/m.38450 type:complete len:81 (-) Transcript_20969:644-886(-)
MCTSMSIVSLVEYQLLPRQNQHKQVQSIKSTQTSLVVYRLSTPMTQRGETYNQEIGPNTHSRTMKNFDRADSNNILQSER